MARRALVLLTLSLLVLAAAACGGDDDDAGGAGASDTGAAATAPGAATTTTPVAAATDDPLLDGVSVTGDAGAAPTVTVQSPFAATQTVRRVLTEGTGEPVTNGVTIVFDYVALNGADGKEFDRSYGATPATATLSVTDIIPGIVKGLLGVNVGSRVVIGIPPADGFGPTGGIEQAGIAAEDSVVFVVDVKDVRTPLTRAEGTPVAPVAGQPTVALDASGAPTITMPGGDPPTTLVAQLLITGTGAKVESGQTITVHYAGAIWASGKVFDASWTRGQPTSFSIGTGNVIVGWDQGLVGQTVGSQVLLVIPPDLGYGAAGNPDAGISGTDTLVFVVDILDAY